jgi:3-oxoacyl-[acyl-carrier-protein] synthase-3
MKDIDLIVPHQTSKLGFRMLKSLNNGNNQNIVNQLEKYGNCIAASIPIALVSSIQDQKLNEGETCFLVGTAAGITVSGMLFKYSKI